MGPRRTSVVRWRLTAREKGQTALRKEAGFSKVRRATQTPFNLVLGARP